jgi:hypothetical protein
VVDLKELNTRLSAAGTSAAVSSNALKPYALFLFTILLKTDVAGRISGRYTASRAATFRAVARPAFLVGGRCHRHTPLAPGATTRGLVAIQAHRGRVTKAGSRHNKALSKRYTCRAMMTVNQP